jgi:hypothetical protein
MSGHPCRPGDLDHKLIADAALSRQSGILIPINVASAASCYFKL